MEQQHRLTTLESGVRIVTEAMPSVRSVSLGFWIGTGSRYEADAEAGLSHLLEHLLFKGTAKYESLQIDQIFDGMGAELNAGTGKETTSVYARVIDEHLVDAFDVMADMVFRPALTDIDSEREVILEEIAMYEDDPQEKVFDMLGEAVFGEDPLGRAIIGRADVISGTPAPEIARFHHARYRPENVVIAAAGAVEHDALVALAARALRSARPAQRRRARRAHACRPRRCRGDAARAALRAQGHRAVPRLPGRDRPVAPRRPPLRPARARHRSSGAPRPVALFQEVRERRGLAYSVYSFTSAYSDTGQVGLYVGTRADNLVQALSWSAPSSSASAPSRPPPRSCRRAKENLKGRVVLAMESTGARMNRLGLRDPGRVAGDGARRGRGAHRRGDACPISRRSPTSCGIPSGCRPPGSDPMPGASTRHWASDAGARWTPVG